MLPTDSLEIALKNAWHQDMANSSLQRWLLLCEKKQWGQSPENLDLLVSLFGASWYFTRFVFFRGQKITGIFDETRTLDFTSASLIHDFLKVLKGDDQEIQLEALKIAKNEIMLAILLAQLSRSYTQEAIEAALTKLAEATLFCTLHILSSDNAEIRANIAILAMGRMAGNEMNFGSDLDMIFLYSGGSQEIIYKISLFVRKLMRNIGLLSPAGLLYELDMRLRPHGNSGVLVTGLQSFIDYHQDKREVWERQMMTRCCAVVDDGGVANATLAKIKSSIYQRFDEKNLRNEIIDIRTMVVDELGTKRGEYNVKHGKGGIMDIDFVTHYLQLLHGYSNELLHTSSTRQALRKLSEAGVIDNADSQFLLEAYNYLKIIEGRIRVFDMKPISSFAKNIGDGDGLVRSMNFLNDNTQITAEQFTNEYKNTTQRVRCIFNKIFRIS